MHTLQVSKYDLPDRITHRVHDKKLDLLPQSTKIPNYCDVVSFQHLIVTLPSNFPTYYVLGRITSLSLLVRDKVDTIIHNFSSNRTICLSKENRMKYARALQYYLEETLLLYETQKSQYSFSGLQSLSRNA